MNSGVHDDPGWVSTPKRVRICWRDGRGNIETGALDENGRAEGTGAQAVFRGLSDLVEFDPETRLDSRGTVHLGGERMDLSLFEFLIYLL